MFHQNKYHDWYFALANKAISEGRSKKDGYFERHHIIPKSMGGENRKSNYVLFTEREHFVAHRLLVKMVISSDHRRKMKSAVVMMGNMKKNGQVISSHQYEIVNKYNRDRKVSEDTRKKISDSAKGKTFSEETKHKIAEANRLTYSFISPDNEIIQTSNLKKFCLENDLQYPLMVRLAKGTYPYPKYKNWSMELNNG